MSVVRTDKWLLDLHEHPIEMCKKMKTQFDDAEAYEIYDYLTQHGMYRQPLSNGRSLIKMLQKNKAWEIAEIEMQYLQKKWNGPNIPIFIFPSDPDNRKIKTDLNGKSGLAFHDKLLLFISADNNEREIKALFTHEYNHVCRLTKYYKNEEDYVLLDTIILEGLAENAVREKFGKDSLATWTKYYSNDELEKLWNNLVFPNRNALITDSRHQDLLYGVRYYPRMAGYCVGYYLVKNYMEKNGFKSKDLLNLETKTIAQLNKTNQTDEI